MDKHNQQHAIGNIGGKFHFKHFRNGELLDEGVSDNIYIDQGLINALNVAFANVLAGAPAPSAGFYIGLTQANRVFQSTDKADNTGNAGIHTIGNELENYSEVARPAWTPQNLAIPGTIELSDSGFEGTFTITAVATVYGAFLIDALAKDGSADLVNNVLVAGSNFTNPRNLEIGDIFKVGYDLSAQSGA
jgi:hypothetical protein